jgi:hypothetical protein
MNQDLANLHVLFVAVFFGKKTQKKTNIKCNVIKSTIYIQGELDSLQGIEIEIQMRN